MKYPPKLFVLALHQCWLHSPCLFPRSISLMESQSPTTGNTCHLCSGICWTVLLVYIAFSTIIPLMTFWTSFSCNVLALLDVCEIDQSKSLCQKANCLTIKWNNNSKFLGSEIVDWYWSSWYIPVTSWGVQRHLFWQPTRLPIIPSPSSLWFYI